ncbi:hypothetical protein [Alteribacillus bidgolensis]|uniref:Uncharacterized protein n=1 Tax=Alteribacillus bidgolensis TaxID=930129 RepID=A0A1G8J9L5_9BACI|nr:hypothetical protein [Alteribacillus bidgolensis]SDI27687.1 hypothetical protein SAMN05216352_106102 [Alteribacillus bidgolensis]
MKRNGFILFLVILTLTGYFTITAGSKMELENNNNKTPIHVSPLAP